MHTWLHLVYKIPRNPSKHRVYVWRKLKQIGAVLIHDSIWCLPSTSKNKEQFQWLMVEIQELGGEASLWESRLVLGEQDESLVQQFLEQVDTEYQKILDELKQDEFDLVALSKKFQHIRMQDYFKSELGIRVQEVLLNARRGVNQ